MNLKLYFQFYPPKPSLNSQNTLPHLYINLFLTLYPHNFPPSKSPLLFSSFSQQLASTQEALEEEAFNKAVVSRLYEALRIRDTAAIGKLLAADLEWWFHGPPSHQYLMRLLTGKHDSDFQFVPHSISAFGSIVLAEGFDQSSSVAWIHAWTVADGVITQVREYFNTSLTVTRIGKKDQSNCGTSLRFNSVWESSVLDLVGKSVPGLVLAI